MMNNSHILVHSFQIFDPIRKNNQFFQNHHYDIHMANIIIPSTIISPGIRRYLSTMVEFFISFLYNSFCFSYNIVGIEYCCLINLSEQNIYITLGLVNPIINRMCTYNFYTQYQLFFQVNILL